MITTTKEELVETLQKSTNQVKEAFAGQISDLTNQVKELSNKVELTEKALETEKASKVPIQVKDAPSFPLGKIAIATVLAQKQGKSTLDYLKGLPSDNGTNRAINLMEKGLGIGSIVEGSGLLEQLEFIELLRPASVVKSAGVQVVQLVGGKRTYNTQTSGSTAYWLATDSTTITGSQPVFGQKELNAKKLAALVQVSNDEIRLASADIESIIQQDLLLQIGIKQDEGFLIGTGGSGQPTGLINIAGINTFARTSSPDATKVGKDLINAKKRLALSNAPMDKLVWFMNPETYYSITGLRDSNSNLVDYARTAQESGTIYGAKVFLSTQLTKTSVILANASSLVIGEGYGITTDIDMSLGFASDTTYVRGIVTTDIGAKYEKAVCTITSVDWDTL